MNLIKAFIDEPFDFIVGGICLVGIGALVCGAALDIVRAILG
jgi:hypothetical protein